MSQANQLVMALKKLLKRKGVTYKQLAEQLHLSEASVKRQFSKKNLSLQSLEAICNLIQIEFSDLAMAAEALESLSQLSESQELELVKDEKSILVAICVLNHWSFQKIVATYQINEAECTRQFIHLERIGLIRLLAENRVKLKISRDFSWLAGGPIHRFFKEHAQADFLNSNFNQVGEIFRFQHAMISPAANLQFQQRLLKLMQEFTDLHEENSHAPEHTRFGTSLLMAMRPWEPQVFQSLRRKPDNRSFIYPKL